MARLITRRVALALAALWLAGLGWFVLTIPKNAADPERATDAIVVLTGGSQRLKEGFALLTDKKARKLFVSGVYRGVDVAALARVNNQATSQVACCVVLGHAADSTSGNAQETAAWMRREGYRSLRLVTANYHMRRSLLEFRHAMPEAVILAHPVFPDAPDPSGAWPIRGASLIVTEYSKYLAALVRIALAEAFARGSV